MKNSRPPREDRSPSLSQILMNAAALLFWIFLANTAPASPINYTASYDGTYNPYSVTPPAGQSTWSQGTATLPVSPNDDNGSTSAGLANLNDTSTGARVMMNRAFSGTNTPFSANQAQDTWKFSVRIKLYAAGVAQSGPVAPVSIGFRDEFNGVGYGRAAMLGFFLDTDSVTPGNQAGIRLVDANCNVTSMEISNVTPFDGLFHTYDVVKYFDPEDFQTKVSVYMDGALVTTVLYSMMPIAASGSLGFGYYGSTPSAARVTVDSLTVGPDTPANPIDFSASYDGTYNPYSGSPPAGQSTWSQGTATLPVTENNDNGVSSDGIANLNDTSGGARVMMNRSFTAMDTPFTSNQATDTWKYSVTIKFYAADVAQSSNVAPVSIGFRDEFNGTNNGKVAMLGFFLDADSSTAGNQPGIRFTDGSAALTNLAISNASPFDGQSHIYDVVKFIDAQDLQTKVSVYRDGVLAVTVLYNDLPSATSSNLGFGYFGSTPGTARVALDNLTVGECGSAGHLAVTYGPQGLFYLSYNGTQLLDGSLNFYDSFFIEYVEFRRPDGSTYLWYWGNGAYERVMDYSANRINWVFAWGIVSCQYTKQDDKLLCAINIQNDSADTVTGMLCHPMQLHFADTKPPELDNGLVNVGLSYQGPVAIRASFDGGVMVVSDETPTKHTYVGLHVSDMGGGLPGYVYKFHANAHAWWWYPSDLPRFYTSIAPGTSYSYTVSARFAPAGTPTKDIVPDVYESYRGVYPYELYWNDRRPIAQVFLSSYGSGVAGDPRGWIFYDPAVDGDIATTAGKANFRTKLLALADGMVTRAQSMNAQGVITWDIEGQEWWHPISYIGDPSQAEDFAPELAYKPTPSDLSTVDAYFKKFTDAGLTPGVTIRPQTMVRTVSGTTVTAQQVEATAATSPTFQQNVIDKAEYARDRWGCRILYVDTNVINATLGDPPAIYEAALAAVPDVLFIPEWTRVRTYAASAAYGIITPTIGFSRLGTPQEVLDVYPQAFSAMAEGSGSTPTYYENHKATLTQSVRRGDILMYQGWWDNPINAKVKSIYLDAGLTPVSTGGYNGSFEKDLDSDGQADGWGLARENAETAAGGTYYVRPSVTTGSNPTFIYTDVKRYTNIPFKYTGSPMTLSVSVRDTTNAQFDSFQYYIEISWEEGGTTYTANTFNSWSSTGAKNTTSWRPLQWTAAISGLTSNGHSIANGTNHRITFLQLRCGDTTSTQANTLYEMLVDDFALSYTP